ncbi:MAG: hemerythrin domain-containing protein [Bryobacteraceae bacterium]
MLTVADLLRGPRAPEMTDDPIEHLSACHRRVEQRLQTLARAGSAFASQRDEALRAIDAAVHFFATNGVLHTADEEESVFPRLAPKLEPAEREVIEALERDHETAAGLHAELDVLVQRLRGDPAGEAPVEAYLECVRRLTALYARHIAVEDSQVAALARSRFSEPELAAIHAEMKQRREKQ